MQAHMHARFNANSKQWKTMHFSKTMFWSWTCFSNLFWRDYAFTLVYFHVCMHETSDVHWVFFHSICYILGCGLFGPKRIWQIDVFLSSKSMLPKNDAISFQIAQKQARIAKTELTAHRTCNQLAILHVDHPITLNMGMTPPLDCTGSPWTS